MKLFERADKYLNIETNNSILPVIVFDEIGLAELSSHNPLKVLHEKLEIETCQYGFVGLSNWQLDAAKMNRVLYLACTDPDVNDLQLTAEIISSSLVSNSNRTDSIASSVNYFGLRDFYSLIKGVVNDLIHSTNYDESNSIVQRQIEINFGDIFDGSKFLWQRFCQYTNQEYLLEKETPLKLDQIIDRSLSLGNSRYLMLIGDSESAFDYVERYINRKQQSIRTLIGSSLIDDLVGGTTYNEQYNRRVLMDIILHAETSVTLIMRRMDNIYANHDLFNQNFDISGDLPECDPPFLSRFEKHLIDIESLIHPCHLTITSNLLQWIDKLVSFSSSKKFPQAKHLFVDYSPDYICHLVMDAFEDLQISENDIDNYTDTSKFNDDNSVQLLIEQYYNIHNQLSFSHLIDHALSQSNISNQVIYTYTQIYEKLEYLDNNDSVVEIKIGNLKSEFELRQRINEHYRSCTAHLLLIRVDYHHQDKHILLLKYLILNERRQTSDHGIWLVFHLERHLMHEMRSDVLFNRWPSVMIDNLNQHRILPWNVLFSPSYHHLLLHTNLSLSHTDFCELIIQCFKRVRYTVVCRNKENLINDRCGSIINLLIAKNIDTESFQSLIKNRLLELIRTVDLTCLHSEFTDWRFDFLTNATIIGSCRSIDDALKILILRFYCNCFLMLLSQMETSSLIDSYLCLMSVKNENIYENLKSIWYDSLKLTFEKHEETMKIIDTIEIPIIFDLHLPRARFEHENIDRISEMCKQYNDLPHDKLLYFAMEKLRNTCVYGKNIERILENSELFEHYFYDRLVLVLDELQIDHLSVLFVQSLLTSNPNLTIEDKLKHFLIYYDELIELLNLFDIGFRLIEEAK
ncbi:unnamed protein product [Rotaria sp. Silwood1]|nr:unnamed protein product [Rotaria sp. Silwood1]